MTQKVFEPYETIDEYYDGEDAPKLVPLTMTFNVSDAYNTPEDTAEEVMESLEWLTPGGGHAGIFGATASWGEDAEPQLRKDRADLLQVVAECLLMGNLDGCTMAHEGEMLDLQTYMERRFGMHVLVHSQNVVIEDDPR